MRALFVSSEVFPLVKTGGLADVAGALPAALAALGTDIRILMPGYGPALDAAEGKRNVGILDTPFGLDGEVKLVSARLPGSGVPIWLIDYPPLYHRDGGPYLDAAGNDFEDNWLRFGLLSWAAALLATGQGPKKWRPRVLHLNDWQTGLAAAYLRVWKGVTTGPGTLLTIHNIAYQGLFPKETMPKLGLPWDMFQINGLEYWDKVSFLKAAISYCDRITTVSRRYAKEIQTSPFGCGLEGVLAGRSSDLVGILNGADYDVWTPESDPFLVHQYPSSELVAGKAANKAALQAELGLEGDPKAPLLVVVSRLNQLKGMDLVLGVLPAILAQGGQLAVVGTGDAALEQAFMAAADNNPRRVAVQITYSEPLAHRMLAGGDMLLMPSRYEPCGLTQLYAFRYGTVPVVHATGGLADTVTDATVDGMMTGTATGFVSEHSHIGAIRRSIERAIDFYRHKDKWRPIQQTAVAQDFSWRRSAQRYLEVYRAIAGLRGGNEPDPS